MKIDDFIKLLEEKKAEGFTNLIKHEFHPETKTTKYKEIKVDDIRLSSDGKNLVTINIEPNLKDLIDSKVLIII